MSLIGQEAFDQFYGEIYGERWPTLKTSLLNPKKHILIHNPYSASDFPKNGQKFEDTDLIHQISDSISNTEKSSNGYMNFLQVDIASILAVEALAPQAGERVADLCATTAVRSFLCSVKMENKGLLISNDSSAARRARIQKVYDEYIPKTQQTNHKITGHDVSKWRLYEKNLYNKVLLDAPCSIEKLFLENEQDLAQWTPGKTKATAVAQFNMLSSAMDIAKAGATVVYMTSSLSPYENDDLIEKLHRNRGGKFVIIEKLFSLGTKTKHGWQILPDLDGHGPSYVSIIKKLK